MARRLTRWSKSICASYPAPGLCALSGECPLCETRNPFAQTCLGRKESVEKPE